MNSERPVRDYVLAYLCWFISTLVGFLILNLAREMVLMAITVSGANLTDNTEAFYQGLRAGAVAQWSWLIIGLVAIALLVGFEHLYRNAVHTRNVVKYFFLLTGIQAAVLLVIHLVYYILAATFLPIGWLPFVILAAEAAFAVLFLWLWKIQRRVTVYE